MVKQKSLTTVLQRLSVDLYSLIDINTPIGQMNDQGPVARCPECGSSMEYYGYMESNTVMIDYCASCHWLWIDAMELATITKMFVQFQKIKIEIDQTHRYTSSDIAGVHIAAEAVFKAFLGGFII